MSRVMMEWTMEGSSQEQIAAKLRAAADAVEQGQGFAEIMVEDHGDFEHCRSVGWLFKRGTYARRRREETITIKVTMMPNWDDWQKLSDL